MGNPLVASGRRNRRVTIIRDGAAVLGDSWTGTETAPTADSWGEETSVPGEIARWVSQRPAPGLERFQSAENAANAVMRFVFRWEADLVRVTDRLRTKDLRVWDIKSAEEIGLREGWEVLAIARAEKV